MSFGLDFVKVTLDDGSSHGADLVNLGDVDTLSGIITLIVQPILGACQYGSHNIKSASGLAGTYLDCLKLSLDSLLCFFAGKFGVLLVKLGTKVVDVGLELVLLLLGIGNKLVLHDHGGLLLAENRLGAIIQRSSTAGNGEIALSDLLLNLAGLLGTIILLVRVHSL